MLPGWVRRRIRPRGLSGVSMLIIGLTGLFPVSAPAVEVENLRVGFSSNSLNNLFKVGTWTPLEVQLKGGAQRFTGMMVVEVPDDDGTPTAFRLPVDVPAGGSVRYVTYARPGSRDPSFVVRLYDESGRRRAESDNANAKTLSPIMPDETLLLTLGKPSGVDQVAGLPGFGNKTDLSPGQQELTVAHVEPQSGTLPGRWYGYDAADAIVIDTNDKELMEALSVRGQAIVEWVARGGHLVVALGANWQSVRDSVLGPLLPALPTGQIQLKSLDLKTLDTFAGAAKSIASPDAPPVLVAKLEQIDERGGRILSAASDVPLVVRGAYQFGRVTLVAFDTDQKPFADWPDRAQFWVKAMDLRGRSAPAPGATVQIGGGGRRMYQTGISDLSTQLRATLEQFPGVKLIPFGWVAFFIFLYILLIGPGDYFFLKKVVKRMEFTWVTFPLIVLTVSLLAYFAAYLVKGRDLRINKVDVVDVDAAAGQARGTTFVNLFSPQNRDYDISVVPLPLDRDLPAAEPGGSAAASTTTKAARPPAGTEVMVTWLGVPEAGFGGMGGGGRIGFSNGGYTSAPPGSSESLEGVRIPIWSTKLLTARWFGPSTSPAEADLIRVGSDRLNGTVTNKLSVPLNDAILAFKKHVYQLGTLAPGATVRVELKQDRQLPNFLKSKTVNPSAETNSAGNQSVRSDLVLALMFHDSQPASVSSDQQVPSNTLHYLDLTGQLTLERPMLVGRIDRPASQLVLGNASNIPKVNQTTMIRVILPLNSK